MAASLPTTSRDLIIAVRPTPSLSRCSNLNGLFEECYSLAATQQRKNKDIPESGSKVSSLTIRVSFSANRYSHLYLFFMSTPHLTMSSAFGYIFSSAQGVILLNLAHQDKASVAFLKYIDSVLDLMMGHARSDVVDYMGGQREILFLGPDENTADLMDRACE